MARVTYGPYITELAGSVGGFTFLRNASGPIVKLRSNPTVNPSPDQSVYQTNLAKLVAYWPTLSGANKDLWDAFALAHDHTTPWGETRTLSGYQWFISVNLNMLFMERSILSSPPAWVVYSPPPAFIIQVAATYIRLLWDPEWTPDAYWTLYVSLPLRQSSLKLRHPLFALHHRTSSNPVGSQDFTYIYELLTNITWSTFYPSANCSIIARVLQISHTRGLTSAFTSAIVKID